MQPPDLPYKLRRLADLNAHTPGLPVCYFPALEQLTSLVDGKPSMVGPIWSLPAGEKMIPTVRTIGFRKGAGANGPMPPILHAKLALLGRFWEHDEDDFGPADVTTFTAKRLWIGSANFTASSRRRLEFGFWTEDPVLLRGAEEFLLDLIGSSEGIDPDADVHMPERALPDYDEQQWRKRRPNYGSLTSTTTNAPALGLRPTRVESAGSPTIGVTIALAAGESGPAARPETRC